MSTRYEVNVEKRAGRLMAEIVRETVTTPTSGRGKEWQQTTREVEVYAIPVSDLPSLAEAIASGLAYAVTDHDEITVRDEPSFALCEHRKDDDPTMFWSVPEVRSYVRQARLDGKDTSEWVLRRPDGDFIEGYAR